MAPHSSTLAWKIPRTEEPGGLPSTGLHRVGHNWSDLAAAAATWSLKMYIFKLTIVELTWINRHLIFIYMSKTTCTVEIKNLSVVIFSLENGWEPCIWIILYLKICLILSTLPIFYTSYQHKLKFICNSCLPFSL